MKPAKKTVTTTVRPAPSLRELAYLEAASNEQTRDVNRDLALERIRALQPISRVDLARASGLQPSTVSSIVEQLLEERWIREGAIVKTARGRRPTMLSLNDEMAILAADVRPAQAVLAVVDLNGRFLSRVVVPLASNAQQSVAAIARAMKDLRGQFPGKTFQGVGLSLPGRVDPGSNRLLLAPNLQWESYDIAGDLSAKLGLRVELENAANACMLSELWFGHLNKIRNAVLLTISEGVGAAVLAEGRLISGRGGLAGEFGHVVVDPAGPLCGCGQRGCWEQFASSRAALRYYAELAPAAAKLSIGELVALAMDGDAPAKKAIDRQAIAIGRGVRMLKATLAPDVILFAGDISNFWPMSQSLITSESRGGIPVDFEPELLSIGDGELARLRGAVAVVLQRHSGYYRSGHGIARHGPAKLVPAKRSRK
ncbi:Sugar kinase of the NBD/HSP70 family, may contain an N-terminal HTH domain [Granulicella rosea]|uniref:Sugar kinase of the NBD/HSP70 family, may contain an N-terminal HTH domain n=1 Tax=Granulicella rosea TaxID=474952 RepID=A0A239M407_9BACT|nr:ROK family protein [Granulicella rosea]SNT36704.1 Sugar kinase of the NBD/HSP70 family, may contain an N-terminal HTH domain [Granulicella rosea]